MKDRLPRIVAVALVTVLSTAPGAVDGLLGREPAAPPPTGARQASQAARASQSNQTDPTGSSSDTYAVAQAERGAEIYAESCASCHGVSLEGGAAPELSGRIFRKTWSLPQVTTDDLHFVITTTMPPTDPGGLEAEAYLDVLAYILQQNGVPAGPEALRAQPERLREIRMAEVDADAPPLAPPLLEGERTEPTGTGPTVDELRGAGSRDADWPYHSRDLQGTRHVPLSEIDPSNAAELRPVCLYQLGDPGNFQTGPVVHDGVMYVTGVHTTAAIDAATCRPIWRHRWRPRDREGYQNSRGVAIQDGYVVRGTSDGYLLALDASDGEMLWARQIADPWIGETFTMPPMILGDRIFIGPAVSENAISGWLGAFSLRDGEPLWKFSTVPGATREGSETWGNPRGIPLGGGATWTPLSLSPDGRELYVSVSNPAPDLPAFLRPGPNLYTNSIVALDPASGELLWYRQLVPNDDHDWDLTQVSPVFGGTVAGEERPLVATAGKDGMLRLLDRSSHEVLWETAVTTRENAEAPVTSDPQLVCPGVLGGVQWNGPALLPEEGLLLTPAVDWCAVYAAAEEVRYVPGQMYMGGVARPQAERQGWLTAVDVSDGSVRWRYRSEEPMIAGVTTTASGLVLAGELTGDFIVLDGRSGEELYRFFTGGPMGGGVISYAVDGRQYVATASGPPSGLWPTPHPGSATIVVFGLPGS